MVHELNVSQAISEALRLASVSIISMCSVTQRTDLVGTLSHGCMQNRLQARLLPVESVRGALAVSMEAARAGIRSFAVTYNRGLSLMREYALWSSSASLPPVAIEIEGDGTASLDIWIEQREHLVRKHVNWIQVHCETAQEVLDTILVAYRVQETVGLPVMIVLDESSLDRFPEPVNIPSQKYVDRFLPTLMREYRPVIKESALLQFRLLPGDSGESGSLVDASTERVLVRFEEIEEYFMNVFQRSYAAAEAVNCDDADIILVTAGMTADTARRVVEALRAKGEKAGLLRVRLLRPFPADLIRRTLAPARKVAVVDRDASLDARNRIMKEVDAALHGNVPVPAVFPYVAGIGGRTVGAGELEDIYWRTKREDQPDGEGIWLDARMTSKWNSV
ncbi:MAG: pyruvate ferredoxin oxidoreductase [Deltaproteobacteria bacterium]|nr:pyruvate ferredoxin oxidoreductase [Deltaproteobacteria bacterium]